MPDHSGEQALGKDATRWLGITLTIMLGIGILLPSILYGILLQPRSAAEVMVAAGTSLFAAIVYLWTLHAISIISFRDSWMSKAIFSAAVTGILATAVVVFKGQVTSTFPLEGKWELDLSRVVDGEAKCVWSGEVLIVNIPSRDIYIGLSANNEDTNGCDYGVKDIKTIEWDDREKGLTFYVANYPIGPGHDAQKQAPTSPLIFELKEHNKIWESVVKKDAKDNSSSFRVSMKRLL